MYNELNDYFMLFYFSFQVELDNLHVIWFIFKLDSRIYHPDQTRRSNSFYEPRYNTNDESSSREGGREAASVSSAEFF
jgi:hypothetical protein